MTANASQMTIRIPKEWLPTAANGSQRQPTAANGSQRQPTAALVRNDSIAPRARYAEATAAARLERLERENAALTEQLAAAKAALSGGVAAAGAAAGGNSPSAAQPRRQQEVGLGRILAFSL
jgi:hypothetical protein